MTLHVANRTDGVVTLVLAETLQAAAVAKPRHGAIARGAAGVPLFRLAPLIVSLGAHQSKTLKVVLTAPARAYLLHHRPKTVHFTIQLTAYDQALGIRSFTDRTAVKPALPRK